MATTFSRESVGDCRKKLIAEVSETSSEQEVEKVAL
jgi:hypothetical protein